jgi:spore maturation protein CgeB
LNKEPVSLKLVIFGLSITSSWGNGHATTYRALTRALHARGHQSVFFERNEEWYAENRDLPEPEFCQVHLFDDWKKALPTIRRELANCDVAMVGSYFRDGIEAVKELVGADVPVKSFYDIDTPITVSRLREDSAEYLRADQVPLFDLYFSFTGGPMLRELESRFGARKVVPLYCSVDREKYFPRELNRDFKCDLSYMGTYAPDRQPKLEELLCAPARQVPNRNFLIIGSQYPNAAWPANVRHIAHLSPEWHAQLYSSSRFVLNLTRQEMVIAGYSPSVRLFEAGACGAAMISDAWPGMESFFVPGEEILLAKDSRQVLGYLKEMDAEKLAEIGTRARARVLAEHTSDRRAEQFEAHVARVLSLKEDSPALAGSPGTQPRP